MPIDPSPATEEHRFPCPSCGANLRFAPGQDRLICHHCGHTEPVDGAQIAPPAIRELDFQAALNAQLPQQEIEETRVVKCTNCGAEVEADPTNHAHECPFCASPIVTDTGTHRHIKPRGLLPFALSESDARDAMNTWLGRLWFAPNGLRDYARRDRRMQGIYVPYWTYDADTKTAYRGERGDDYYVTRTVMRDGKPTQVQERRTRWRPASGKVARFFDDVLVLASKSLPKRYTDALEPWDLAALEPYRPEFLAGFRAEGYTVELAQGYDEARTRMDRIIARDVRFDIGGDHQRIHTLDTTVSDVTFKHILLPVWLAAYRYRGKSYRFVVNGRTGQVRGERPWSVWKITFAVILGALLAAGLGYAFANLQ